MWYQKQHHQHQQLIITRNSSISSKAHRLACPHEQGCVQKKLDSKPNLTTHSCLDEMFNRRSLVQVSMLGK